MLNMLLELITGKDDLERVAWTNDLGRLNAYLVTRKLLIPRRPKRYLDPEKMTQDEFVQMLEAELKDAAEEPFDPWILENDGQRRLPAFSSTRKSEVFVKTLSPKLNKVFALNCGEVLIKDIAENCDVDFIDLNLFSEKSWEIAVKR